MDHLRGRERHRIIHATAWQVLVHAQAAVTGDDDTTAKSEHAQALEHLETIVRVGGEASMLAVAQSWTDLLRHMFPTTLGQMDTHDALVSTCLVDEDGTQLSPETLGPALGLSTVMLGALLVKDTDQCQALMGAARASDVLAPMLANVAYALCSLAHQMGAPTDWADPMCEFSLACPRCAAALGTQHHTECEHGWCRGTGRPLPLCAHTEHVDACEPAIWDGYPHGTVECMQADLYRTWEPGQGWVACSYDTPRARIDLSRLWRTGRWDPHEQAWTPV